MRMAPCHGLGSLTKHKGIIEKKRKRKTNSSAPVFMSVSWLVTCETNSMLSHWMYVISLRLWVKTSSPSSSPCQAFCNSNQESSHYHFGSSSPPSEENTEGQSVSWWQQRTQTVPHFLVDGKGPEIRHLQGLTLVPYFLSPGPIRQHSACEPMEAVPRQIIAEHLFQSNLVSSAERNGEIMLSACQVTSRIIAQMTTSHWASRWEVFDVKQGRWVVMWTSPFQGTWFSTMKCRHLGNKHFSNCFLFISSETINYEGFLYSRGILGLIRITFTNKT